MICYLTTSWDDGHPLDFKIVELLHKYHLHGTFYIPLRNGERELMPEREMVSLSSDFEIGAHASDHRSLTHLGLEDAGREIATSKKYLETLLHREVRMFCYPLGHYNRSVIDLVRGSGFLGARTTSIDRLAVPGDPFRIWTTVYANPLVYRASIPRYFGALLAHGNIRSVAREALGALERFKHCKGRHLELLPLARRYFDHFTVHGGIYHLWGHSWEIEELGLWAQLEEIFAYISHHRNVQYLNNGDLYQLVMAR